MTIDDVNGSEVVNMLAEHSRKTWRAWRQHVEAGTEHLPGAAALYEESRLAGATLLSELAARAEIKQARPS